ncbi:MAG: hypothetical protein K0R83_2972, partial [Caulobacter sp.]|nr:hypothetical protein [Caulobacter sp.]
MTWQASPFAASGRGARQIVSAHDQI